MQTVTQMFKSGKLDAGSTGADINDETKEGGNKR